MTEEAKKKRDELAAQYGLNRFPIQNIETRKDFTQDINFARRMSHTEAHQAGFDAGYQVAMDEANERIQKLREALTYYACDNKRQGPDFITVELHEMIIDNGKTARAALKEDSNK